MATVGVKTSSSDLVLAPDPNQPQRGSLPVSRAGREGLVNLLHKLRISRPQNFRGLNLIG